MKLTVPLLATAVLAAAILPSPKVPDPAGTWEGCFRYDADSTVRKCGDIVLTERIVCEGFGRHGSFQLVVTPPQDIFHPDDSAQAAILTVPPEKGLVSWSIEGDSVFIDGTQHGFGSQLGGCVMSDGGLEANGVLDGDSIVGRWGWWWGFPGRSWEGTFTLRHRRPL